MIGEILIKAFTVGGGGRDGGESKDIKHYPRYIYACFSFLFCVWGLRGKKR